MEPCLRKYFLVFFDDILIYNIAWEKHLQHVGQILDFLQDHKLFVKLSKWSFGMEELEYLGYIVRREEVRDDPKKIQEMQDWPQPKILKSLQGFLGLTSYYHESFSNYGWISQPLTNGLKENSFIMIEATQ